MRFLLSTLPEPLEVRPSNSHGRNDCLTDSILLAIEHQGLIETLHVDRRSQLCAAVRRHLETTCGICPHSNPFLSHDQHFHGICQQLRTSLLPIWRAEHTPSQTSFTCIVYDRFNRQMLENADGTYSELVETNPVYSVAPGENALTSLISIYCNTNANGEGWHYEWITPCTMDNSQSENPAPVTPHCGAVEELHLCTNLHKLDALNAECMSTFPIMTVHTEACLRRLEMETEQVA